MTKAVFCIAQNLEQAESIVNNLHTAGFSTNDISVLFPDKSTTQDFAHEKTLKRRKGLQLVGQWV